MERRFRVMLDTNVLIAGVLSPEGGAGAILEACWLGLVEFYLTPGIIKEASGKFNQKFPDLEGLWRLMLKQLNPIIISNPTIKEIDRATELIEPDDAPILAGALKAPIDYFITLDQDVFKPEIVRSAHFSIVTPGGFLADFRHLEKK